MQVTNGKVSFRLPVLKKPNLSILSVIQFLERTVFVLAPAFILFQERGITQVNNWLTIAYILLVLRLIKVLFFGAKAIFSVNYDIALLLAITTILVITIIHGDDIGYSNLGGGDVFGVGMILLTGLTLYLFSMIWREFSNARIAIHSQLFFLNAYLVWQLFSGETDVSSDSLIIKNQYFLIAVVALILNFLVLKYFRHNLAKANAFAGVLVALILGLITLSWAALPNITLALIGFGLVGTILRLVKDKGDFIENITDQFKKTANDMMKGRLSLVHFKLANYEILSLLGGVVTMFLIWIGYMVNKDFGAYLDGILDNYDSIPVFLDNAQSIAIGTGTTAGSIEIVSLIVGYGSIGVLVFAVLVASLSSDTFSQLKESLKSKSYEIASWQFSIAFALTLLFSQMFVGRFSVSLQWLLMVFLVWTFRFPVQSVMNSSDLVSFDAISKNKHLVKLLPPVVWGHFLNALRVIIILIVIFVSPDALEFLRGLY